MNSLENKAPNLFEICKFIHSLHIFDEETIHQVKRVVADTIGAVFSGVQTSVFKVSLSEDVFSLKNGQYPIWGTGITSSLLGSVFYNTLSVSSTDFDEGNRKALGHPACLVVPAALLLGMHFKKSYSEVLKAIIIGYEVGTRFSSARNIEKITTYSTGRWGGIATAATASYLLGLSVNQTMHALSNAAVLSPAMLGGSSDVSSGSMSKEGAAWAAQSGLQSALMAEKGFTGPFLFLDETDEYDKIKLVENLGVNWHINTNYFKLYSCCRWLHPAISAALFLKRKHNILFSEIEQIQVEIFLRAKDLISSRYPENTVQAQFHLPYVLACSILYDNVLPVFFNDDFLVKKEISSLIDKTTILSNDQYSKNFPAKLRSKVAIMLANHSSFSKEILAAPWDAGNHPTDNELFEKFQLQAGEENNYIWNKIMKEGDDSILNF